MFKDACDGRRLVAVAAFLGATALCGGRGVATEPPYDATVTLGNGAAYTGAGRGVAIPTSPPILSANAGLAGADPAQVLSGGVPLPGTKIRLNDTAGPGGRRTYVALRNGDESIPLPDPRVTGATVHIGRVGVGDVTVLDLPADGWGGGTSPRHDYKFKSRTGAVVSARIIEGHSVRVSARGDDAYPLGGIPQGAVGMIVDVGGVRFCGFFGGTITK